MSAVTRSAGVNLTELLNAVGSAAATITTTFNALNSAADTMATHTEAWAARSKVSVQNETLNYLETATERAKFDLAKQFAEIDAERKAIPEVEAHMERVNEIYREKLSR